MIVYIRGWDHMKNSINKIPPRLTTWICLSILIGLMSWTCIRYIYTNYHQSKSSDSNEKTTWMTVFIHGSFGSLMSFLNIGDVIQDKVSGTLYQATTKKMRADDVFFEDQPLLQRGLIPFTPTFNLEATKNKKYVAYPIAAAYQKVTDVIRHGNEENIFYTFGWSGLISQSSRRFEAVRLYNALHKELETLRARGLNPKIRLITHSHGGNVALNLAAINTVLNNALWLKESDQNKHSNAADEALTKMAAIIKEMTTYEDALQKIGQKALDYVPFGRNLQIDELILFGVPIQPETESFCHSQTFNRVYNFYSHEDLVQKMDWITSKQPLSNQRIRDTRQRLTTGIKHHEPVVQAQIMIDRNENELKPVASKTHEPTVLDEVSSGRNIFVRSSNDPTHKELWFMSWNNNGNQASKQSPSIITPLPLVVFTPFLQKAIEETKGRDVRINMRRSGDSILLDVVGKRACKKATSLPLSLIEELIRKVQPWRPEETSQERAVDSVLKHLS